MTINIEEYEYMEGPQSDAGIKVYLGPVPRLLREGEGFPALILNIPLKHNVD